MVGVKQLKHTVDKQVLLETQRSLKLLSVDMAVVNAAAADHLEKLIELLHLRAVKVRTLTELDQLLCSYALWQRFRGAARLRAPILSRRLGGLRFRHLRCCCWGRCYSHWGCCRDRLRNRLRLLHRWSVCNLLLRRWNSVAPSSGRNLACSTAHVTFTA